MKPVSTPLFAWRQMLLAGSCLAASLAAQAPPAIVAEGYTAPSREIIAPGKIITLFVKGLTAPDAQAAQAPLPLELAGVRAVIRYAPTGYERTMPILRIQSIACDPAAILFACDVRAVTLQVPFDLDSLVQRIPTIALYENGAVSHSTEFLASATSPEVLRSCYLFLLPASGPCTSVDFITHADGSLVTNEKPARGGETLVLYFLGLGVTQPYVPEGRDSPAAPASTVITITGDVGTTPAAIQFAGLVPGLVGLYQINLRMPDALPPIVLSVTNGVYRVPIKVQAPGFSNGFTISAVW